MSVVINATTAGQERLRTLYAVMVGVPSKTIDMDTWRCRSGDAISSSDDSLVSVCGTKACAVGWACAYPEFKEQGLHWADTPAYDGWMSWNAVEKFFDVTEEEATILFGGSDIGLAAKKKVLARIREHLLKYGVITQGRSDELAVMEKALTA